MGRNAMRCNAKNIKGVVGLGGVTLWNKGKRPVENDGGQLYSRFKSITIDLMFGWIFFDQFHTTGANLNFVCIFEKIFVENSWKYFFFKRRLWWKVRDGRNFWKSFSILRLFYHRVTLKQNEVFVNSTPFPSLFTIWRKKNTKNALKKSYKFLWSGVGNISRKLHF